MTFQPVSRSDTVTKNAFHVPSNRLVVILLLQVRIINRALVTMTARVPLKFNANNLGRTSLPARTFHVKVLADNHTRSTPRCCVLHAHHNKGGLGVHPKLVVSSSKPTSTRTCGQPPRCSAMHKTSPVLCKTRTYTHTC